MKHALILHLKDNVATVMEPVAVGEPLLATAESAQLTIVAIDPIPIYHKVALCDIQVSSPVIKYGEVIGIATKNIQCGNHVHTHNLAEPVEEK